MPRCDTIPGRRFAGRALRYIPVLLALVLVACATPKPEVTETRRMDDQGREVVTYRICERTGIPFMNEKVCRNETVVHNYCYRSLGRVDCYEQPVPGRTVMRSR